MKVVAILTCSWPAFGVRHLVARFIWMHFLALKITSLVTLIPKHSVPGLKQSLHLEELGLCHVSVISWLTNWPNTPAMSVSKVDSADSSAGLDGGAFWGKSSLLTDLAFGSSFILIWKEKTQEVLYSLQNRLFRYTKAQRNIDCGHHFESNWKTN